MLISKEKNVSLHEETWQTPSPSGDEIPPPEMGPIVIRYLEVRTPGKDMAAPGAVGVSSSAVTRKHHTEGPFLACNLHKCEGHECQRRTEGSSRLETGKPQMGHFCYKGCHWDDGGQGETGFFVLFLQLFCKFDCFKNLKNILSKWIITAT